MYLISRTLRSAVSNVPDTTGAVVILPQDSWEHGEEKVAPGELLLSALPLWWEERDLAKEVREHNFCLRQLLIADKGGIICHDWPGTNIGNVGRNEMSCSAGADQEGGVAGAAAATGCVARGVHPSVSMQHARLGLPRAADTRRGGDQIAQWEGGR
jgi:hypothetical protein